jgi:hypothetical protein
MFESVCSMNEEEEEEEARHEDVLGSGGIAPRILDLGTRWSASRPGRFSPQGKSPWYPLDRRVGGPRAVLDTMEKRKMPSPHRESNPRTPIVQPVAQRYDYYKYVLY